MRIFSAKIREKGLFVFEFCRMTSCQNNLDHLTLEDDRACEGQLQKNTPTVDDDDGSWWISPEKNGKTVEKKTGAHTTSKTNRKMQVTRAVELFCLRIAIRDHHHANPSVPLPPNAMFPPNKQGLKGAPLTIIVPY